MVEQVAPRFSAELAVRDVDADAELLARFGDEVPVLLIDGRKAFKYRVSAADLARRLQAERRRAERRGWRARLFGGR